MKSITFKFFSLILLALSFLSCEKDIITDLKNNSDAQNRIAVSEVIDTLVHPDSIHLTIPTTLSDIYLNSYEYKTEFSASQIQLAPCNNGNPFMIPLIKYNVKSYRITYNTTDDLGNPIQASGSILIPQRNNASDSFSILSAQHGTAFEDEEVEAKTLSQEMYSFASSGFITVVPDYIGYNKSDQIQHPYFINNYSNKTVRDMILASLEYISPNHLNINHDGRLFLHGFSEGANVTLSFLKDVESNPISGLTTIATTAGSGPYNLESQIAYTYTLYVDQDINKASVAATLLSYFVFSYEKNIAKTNNLNIYFRPPYNTNIANYLNGSRPLSNCTLSFQAAMTYYNRWVFTQPIFDPANTSVYPGFRNFLYNNSITTIAQNWTPRTKILLIHGQTDSEVPMAQSVTLYNLLRAKSPDNIYKSYSPGKGHDEVEIYQKAVYWLNENF